MTDRRYRIALEFCGRSEPRYVVRFCDEWIGQSRTRAGAKLIQTAHTAERQVQLDASMEAATLPAWGAA